MMLEQYSGLIRITNKTHKRTLMQFLGMAKARAKTLADYLEK